MISRTSHRTVIAAVGIVAAVAGSCTEVAGPITLSAPTGVTVTLLNPTTARISWNASPETGFVLSYNVMRDGTKIGETSNTFFDDTGLVEGTTYRYQVSANGALGVVSALSDETPAATITAPDVTAPRIASTSPADAATAVPRNTMIAVTFSEAIDEATLNASTFVVRGLGGAPATGTLAYTSATRVVEFRPGTLLPNAASVSVTVTTGIKDPAGNRLGSDFAFSFSTRDEIPPTVSFTSPTNGAASVAVTSGVSVTFSEPMDGTTITTASLAVTTSSGGSPVAGTVGFDAASQTATFTPSVALASTTGYTVNVTTAVKDIAGNAMAAAYAFGFTTADASAPSVISVSPANGATGVSVDAIVSVAFSEPMDPSTITAATLQLRETASGTPVLGVVAYGGGPSATFAPSAPLSHSTAYTFVVSTVARDAAGNSLGSAFLSGFITVAQADVTPPSVVSTSPTSGATSVPVGAVIFAGFSESIDLTSINSGTFALALTANGAVVPGAVSYNASTNTASFTPSVPLAFSTSYTATVTTGIKDLAGNPLTSAVSWSFSTAAAPDVTAPTVVGTQPADGATNISVNAVIGVTFSEAMDQTTINASTVRVTNNSTSAAVSGVVTYSSSNTSATFTPNGTLAFNTGYSITVTTGAKDAAGNSLTTPFSAVFSTAAAPDNTPPTIVTVSPANGATSVSVGTVVNVTFSEAMNSGTVNSGTVTLRVTATSAQVAGSVSYDAGTNTATFVASAPLAFGTGYTVTVTTGARDAAGNGLAGTFTSTFTTGTAPDTTPPSVSGVSPANGATGVTAGTVVTVTFSEAMTASTINSSTVTLKVTASSAQVAGSVTYDPGTNTATFTPNAPLAFSTGYTVNVTTGAKDAAGNSLAGTFSSTFATGVAPDTTPPTVSSTSPASGATNVAVSTLITVTFSEPMSSQTITSSSVRLRNTATSGEVSATVSYNSGTNTATLSPNSPLANSTGYTIIVTTAVRDQAGNQMAGTFNAAFTTVAASDNTPPTVTATSPTNGATDVSLFTTVSFTFSEPMNAATITTSTVRLVVKATSAPAAGSVAYDGTTRTATFTPSAQLEPLTEYTATVTTGARDAAGNALGANVSFSFTTIYAQFIGGYWSGTNDSTAANGGASIHFHFTVDQTYPEPPFSLRPNNCGGRPADCRVYPLNAKGQLYLQSDDPVDVVAASGNFYNPSMSMTFTTANGIVYTYTGTVTDGVVITGTISGGGLPPTPLVMTKTGG